MLTDLRLHGLRLDADACYTRGRMPRDLDMLTLDECYLCDAQ
jgi:hypothetical protein